MLEISDFFTDRVSIARANFLGACDNAGIRVAAYEGHATGTEDDRRPVYADVARFGAPEAERCLTLCPTEGGPSAFLAAALMTASVRRRLYAKLPRDLSLAMVHAINPKGPLWNAGTATPDEASVRADEGWSTELLANAEARYQRDGVTRMPFDRGNLADKPLESVIKPAWGMDTAASIIHDRLPPARQYYVLELGEGHGHAGSAALYCRDEENWFGASIRDAPSQPHFTQGFGTILAHTIKDRPVCVAVARFGTIPGTPEPREDIPPNLLQHTHASWQQSVWNRAETLLSEAIDSANTTDLTERMKPHNRPER